MSITDYIVEFERLYYKIKAHKMVLTDAVLAYQVLQSAKLSAEQQQLARATTTMLKYDIKVAQLKKIFGDSMSASIISTDDVKVKPVFYRKSYCRKLSNSNYPQKPNFQINKTAIKQLVFYFKNNIFYFTKHISKSTYFIVSCTN